MLPLNQTVFLALASALGLDSGDWETSFRIRQALVNPAPPPPPEDQDVVYFHLEPDHRPPLTESSARADGQPAVLRFTPYLLQLVFYGPRAEALAWQVYDHLYLDGCMNPRRILRLNHVYPVPNPPGPSLIWEEWKTHHRPRADLTVPLRVLSQSGEPAPSAGRVDTPPELLIDH